MSTAHVDSAKYPILSRWLARGQIYIELNTYYGWITQDNDNGSTDTFPVMLGNVGYEKDCEDYLTSHPSPSHW